MSDASSDSLSVPENSPSQPLVQNLQQLTEEQYKETLISQMINVTATARPAVDIWPYVERLVTEAVVQAYVVENNLVEVVYRDEANRYDHILLPTENKNMFICIIVDLQQKTITGHYRLDLEKEYGLR
jgi:hypothetical protein